MSILGIAAVVVLAVLGFVLLQAVYLSLVLRWENERTLGLAYYGQPLAKRREFRQALRRHAKLLSPILRLARRSTLDFRKISFRFRDVSSPHGSTSAASFARAVEYQPRSEDVFVVTQMKCGTTWMQHVVYEVLLRGNGDLVERGAALYAVAPWLEGLKSVPIDQAPLVGSERPSRIIKTHLPADLCPWSPDAKYIYVARHPASCFASSVDFVTTNIGGVGPSLEAFEEWFCSPELMWWGTWPDHVAGWAGRATENSNVLFVHFEDMKRDLPGVVRRVTEFLGIKPLDQPELGRVVEKCGFEYMQRHQEAFEMFPPHILRTSGELMVRGTADRHSDVPDEIKTRIVNWAREETAGSSFRWPYEGDRPVAPGVAK